MNNQTINYVVLKEYHSYLLVKFNNDYYNLYIIHKNNNSKYKNILKSKQVAKPVYDYKIENNCFYFYPRPINKTEKIPSLKIKLDLALKIFKEYSYSISLKKEHFNNISNLSKVLDNKFKYLELRIREEETKIKKDDLSWIFLAHVHSIMDSRVILYDLMGDIFNSIDKKETIEYGLVFKNYSSINLNQGKIESSIDYYYGPISALYARIYLGYSSIINISEFEGHIKKLNKLDQKYFCFFVIYVLVLNINLTTFLTRTSIEGFLRASKDIDYFIKNFNNYFK